MTPANAKLSVPPAWPELSVSSVEQRPLETIVLNPAAAVSFHWTDFQDTCQLYQRRVASSPKLREELLMKQAELERLRLIPLWIKRKSGTTHTSLYDLYEQFILETLPLDDANPHVPYDISFVSPSGPFKKLSMSECFNLQTYQNFISVYLLKDKLPARDFRLRVKSRLLVEYGRNLQDVAMVDLEQITTDGLLLRCPSNLFFNGLRAHDQFRLLITTAGLDRLAKKPSWSEFTEFVAGWDVNPFYGQSKLEAFDLNCADLRMHSRFDFTQTRDVYLYLKFSTVKASNELLALRLEQFIHKGKSAMRELLSRA